MTDLQAIKRGARAIFLMLLMLTGAQLARAVIIEGFDDAGNFVAVAVTSDGRLKVAGSSATAQAVFFISSQPVNAFQATSPWIVAPNPGAVFTVTQGVADTWDINCVSGCFGGAGGGTDVVTTPSTTTLGAFGQVALGGSICVLVSGADPDLAQRLFCNASAANTWVALAGACSTTDGTLVAPGACYSPDEPVTYSGEVHFFSTAPATIAFQEIRKP